MRTINVGIIGAGRIGKLHCDNLIRIPGVNVAAITDPFMDNNWAESRQLKVVPSEKSIFNDPEIDAVYVATTHNFHCENVRLCLEHGKHVLCEKPFTVNAAETRELMGLARGRNLFLMEGLWTRFCLQSSTCRNY